MHAQLSNLQPRLAYLFIELHKVYQACIPPVPIARPDLRQILVSMASVVQVAEKCMLSFKLKV